MEDQYFDDVEVRDILGNGVMEACLVDFQGDRAILLRSRLGEAPSILTQELPGRGFELKVRIGPDLYTLREPFKDEESAKQFSIKIEKSFQVSQAS